MIAFILISIYVFGILYSRYVDRKLRRRGGEVTGSIVPSLWFIPLLNIIVPIFIYFTEVYDDSTIYKIKIVNKFFNRDIGDEH